MYELIARKGDIPRDNDGLLQITSKATTCSQAGNGQRRELSRPRLKSIRTTVEPQVRRPLQRFHENPSKNKDDVTSWIRNEMEPLGRIYLTHPSFITTIAAAFTILSGAFLFSLKKKSRATANLAAAFLSISFTSVAFTIAFVLYHPAAALHRWLTVTPVLVGLVFLARFFFHFPHEIRPRACAWITWIFVAAAWPTGRSGSRRTATTGYSAPAPRSGTSRVAVAALNAVLISAYIFSSSPRGTRIAVTRGGTAGRCSTCWPPYRGHRRPGAASMAREGLAERRVFIITCAMVQSWDVITLMFYVSFTTDHTPRARHGHKLVILVARMVMGHVTGMDHATTTARPGVKSNASSRTRRSAPGLRLYHHAQEERPSLFSRVSARHRPREPLESSKRPSPRIAVSAGAEGGG